MSWYQKEIQLPSFGQGCHLITDRILGEVKSLASIAQGLAHIFLLHTSAALALNENTDPTVRHDIDTHLSHLVPPGMPHYRHVLEGPDDMPAHIKTVLVGNSLTIPIQAGRLKLGTWQGVYLCEFRERPRRRRIVVTLMGE